MSFSDSIKTFVDKATASLEDQKARVAENAKRVLSETLGQDAGLIRGIVLNADTGKFHDIDAPEHVIQKLREAKLVEP
jgi:hypothetical protein